MLFKITDAEMLKRICQENNKDQFSTDAYESLFAYFYNTAYYEIIDRVVTIEIEWMDEFTEWNEQEFLDHFELKLQDDETMFDLQRRYNDYAETHYKPVVLDVLPNGNIITRENRWN